MNMLKVFLLQKRGALCNASKNNMGDEVFIINVGGYVGSSTRSEIKYGKKAGKPVGYLELWTNQ